LPLFAASPPRDPAAERVLEQIRAADPDELAPREAHELLRRWRDSLAAEPGAGGESGE
jgi:hypothetical protein